MKTKSRVLALLLALVLCFSTLATTAFAYAEDQDPEPETTTQETTAPEEEENDIAWGYRLLEAAGRKRGFLVSGGEVDTERMARVLLDEYRGGKLGRFTLELPE